MMQFILKVLIGLILFVVEAKGALTSEVQKNSSTWIAFAVGKPYIDSEGYTVKVYPAQGPGETIALSRAITRCQEEAENCVLLPALTTQQMCRYVVVTLEFGKPRWLKAASPEQLQIKCMGLWSGECSKPAGTCR